jgi:hypothetical protein
MRSSGLLVGIVLRAVARPPSAAAARGVTCALPLRLPLAALPREMG